MALKRLALIALLLIAVTNPGCQSSSLPTLRIATDAAFAPFHYLDEAGKPTGFDIELARQVAIRAGYKPQFVVVSQYRDLFTGLVAGDFDMIAATTGITPERQVIYLFSKPYFTTCQAAIVRRGDDEPQAILSLRNKPIAAPAGTSSVAAANTLQPQTLQQVAGSTEGLAALLTQVDGDYAATAYICDEFEAVAIAAANPRLTVLSEPVLLEQYGFVMRLEDRELKGRIDTALRNLTLDRSTIKLRSQFGLERPKDWPIEFSSDISSVIEPRTIQ